MPKIELWVCVSYRKSMYLLGTGVLLLDFLAKTSFLLSD